MGVTGDPTNQVPTASFTAPSVVLTNQQATFDGSASSDPDGSIADYRWDLDGDGSFETDTGTTPFTSTSYPAAGTVPVKLRVTDSGGATAQTSRTVTVNAPAVTSPPPPPAATTITTPPQAVFPPAVSAGQPSTALPRCSSIRKQRRSLTAKRSAARRKLRRAKTAASKRRYGSQVRTLSRKISKLAKTRCSA
jgi:hypothetical protein